MSKPHYTPEEIAPCLGVEAQMLRISVRNNPLNVPFDVIVTGKRAKFPKRSYEEWAAKEGYPIPGKELPNA